MHPAQRILLTVDKVIGKCATTVLGSFKLTRSEEAVLYLEKAVENRTLKHYYMRTRHVSTDEHSELKHSELRDILALFRSLSGKRSGIVVTAFVWSIGWSSPCKRTGE